MLKEDLMCEIIDNITNDVEYANEIFSSMLSKPPINTTKSTENEPISKSDPLKTTVKIFVHSDLLTGNDEVFFNGTMLGSTPVHFFAETEKEHLVEVIRKKNKEKVVYRGKLDACGKIKFYFRGNKTINPVYINECK